MTDSVPKSPTCRGILAVHHETTPATTRRDRALIGHFYYAGNSGELPSPALGAILVFVSILAFHLLQGWELLIVLEAPFSTLRVGYVGLIFLAALVNAPSPAI